MSESDYLDDGVDYLEDSIPSCNATSEKDCRGCVMNGNCNKQMDFDY